MLPQHPHLGSSPASLGSSHFQVSLLPTDRRGSGVGVGGCRPLRQLYSIEREVIMTWASLTVSPEVGHITLPQFHHP